jgi:ABC-type Fe3+ transport system permease subunit
MSKPMSTQRDLGHSRHSLHRRGRLAGNYQIAAITALILLVPSIAFMLLIERFLSTETLAKIG